MKVRRNAILVIMGLMFGLLSPGCLEIKLNTRVNRDGSLVRTQKLTGDSTEILGNKFPSVVDSSWEVSVRYIKEPEANKGWERVAVKTFKDAKELNEAMVGAPLLSLRIHANLDKRFLWFFTEYTYRETYLCYSPFMTIPSSKYVTQAEVDKLYQQETKKEKPTTTEDSLSMKDLGDRFMDWRARNMFEAYFAELKVGTMAMHDPGFSASSLEDHKEDLYLHMKDLIASSGNTDTLLQIAQRVLKNPKVRLAARLNERGFASFREKLDFVDGIAHSLQTSITVPGLIIDTNAPTVEGSTATWKNVDTWAYIGDFDVWVKSRIVNWWAVGIGGVVVVGALVLLLASVFRRRTRPVAAA